MGSSKSLSICIFTHHYEPQLSGIGNFVKNASKALLKRGNKVLVVTTDSCNVGVGFTTENGIEILRLPCHPLLNGRLPLIKHDKQFKQLLNQLNDYTFDAVLVNTRFYSFSLFGMKFARARNLCPVVLDHGSAYISFGNPVLDPIVKAYEHAITAWGKWRYKPDYYGISQKSLEWLAHFGIQAKGVISNSIDAGAYRSAASARDFRAGLNLGADTFMATFVGRFIPEKGIHSIIEASKDFRITSCNIVFVLAGSGPLQDEITASESLNLRCVGRLSQADTSALLQTSNVFCLPTRSEGFSTVLLEASACGLPSIVTNVGGAQELIPSKEYGNIIDPRSSEDLIKAVVELYNNRELLHTQSVNCKAWVEANYSWNATAQAVEKALKKKA